jgi:hypothetical protein
MRAQHNRVVAEREERVGWAARDDERVNTTMAFGTACFARSVSAQSCTTDFPRSHHIMSLLAKKMKQGSPPVLS